MFLIQISLFRRELKAETFLFFFFRGVENFSFVFSVPTRKTFFFNLKLFVCNFSACSLSQSFSFAFFYQAMLFITRQKISMWRRRKNSEKLYCFSDLVLCESLFLYHPSRAFFWLPKKRNFPRQLQKFSFSLYWFFITREGT